MIRSPAFRLKKHSETQIVAKIAKSGKSNREWEQGYSDTLLVARRLPFGAKAIARTELADFPSVYNSSPVPVSQMRTFPVGLPEATSWPSGDTATGADRLLGIQQQNSAKGRQWFIDKLDLSPALITPNPDCNPLAVREER